MKTVFERGTLFHRWAVLLAALGLLAACSVEPLLDAQSANTLRVRSVSVDTSGMSKVLGGLDLIFTPEQIQADLTSALTTHLEVSNAGNADVQIEITAMYLVSPGQSFLMSGRSSIQGEIRVTDAMTGRVILAPTRVTGLSDEIHLGGSVGGWSNISAARDYQKSIAGFAATIRARLFGG